jgi:hypothetical protein
LRKKYDICYNIIDYNILQNKKMGEENEKIVIGEKTKINEAIKEKLKSPEKKINLEKSTFEHNEKKAESKHAEKFSDIPKEGEGEIGGIVSAGNAQQQKSQQVKNIENIMSEDLKDVYLSMNKEKRVEFKKIGEETAIKINELLEKSKVKIKKVIELLKKWLSLIPGANKYFLEQRAKIKADEIIELNNKNE